MRFMGYSLPGNRNPFRNGGKGLEVVVHCEEHLLHIGKSQLAWMMLLERVQLPDRNFVLLEDVGSVKNARMSLTNAFGGGNSMGLLGMAWR
jgi:hypothetical protein